MRHKGAALLSLIVSVFLAVPSYCQNWTGIISPSRATDWTSAGVVGGIPSGAWSQCGSTIAAYTGTADAINNALTACAANHYVQLGSGTFTLSTGVMIQKNNVALRGQGANNTILKINGQTVDSCHISGARALNMCNASGNIGVDSPDNTATWSAGYAQNTTVITLSAHTNLAVGSTIWLDQLDDANCTGGEYPGAGDVCVTNWGAGDSFERANRGLTEGHIVTACGTSVQGAACTSNSITISPGVMMPVVRSGKSPGAWWGNTTSILSGAGLENLTVDSSGGTNDAIYMINCTNCWIKGIRVVYTPIASGGTIRLVQFVNSVNCSVVNSYFYGPQASGLVSMYGLSSAIMSSMLFQNNIVHASVNPWVINSPTYGSVFAYNYFDNTGVNPDFSQPSFILHGHASMNLFEGNNGRNFSGDNIHTAHFFNTLFRNHHDGTVHNPSGTETEAGVALYAAQRFFNLIGNVISSSSDWNTYNNSQSPPAFCQTCIFEFGWEGSNSGGIAATGNDTNTQRTVMRWGNYDNVNGSVRFVSAEVPSGITNYPNPVPGNQTLPSSFYLLGQPSSWWTTPWGTPKWPPIGPDVSSGNISNPSTGGHADKIPARLCFENSASDSAYSGTNPRVRTFNAATCYTGSSGSPPVPPTGLAAVIH